MEQKKTKNYEQKFKNSKAISDFLEAVKNKKIWDRNAALRKTNITLVKNLQSI